MKDFLCPKKSSLKDDSNGTKNETDKRILWFFMIGQSFVKSIGVFPGPWSILLKKHPVLKELKTMRTNFVCAFIAVVCARHSLTINIKQIPILSAVLSAINPDVVDVLEKIQTKRVCSTGCILEFSGTFS